MKHSAAISSRDNPKFRAWLDLLSSKGLRRHGLALIAGPRQVDEALAKHPGLAVALLVPAGVEARAVAAAAALDRFELAPALFRELDVAGTDAPLLLVRQPPVAPWADGEPWPDGCTLFVGFQNPDNVGSVIRSAAAFGVARVVLLREAAHPFLPKSSRAAGSAILDLPLIWGPSIRDLTAVPVPMISLDARGDELEARPFPPVFGLLAGLEGPGLPAAYRAGDCRSIPMEPGQESLNGPTAVAVALYAWRRSRKGPSPG